MFIKKDIYKKKYTQEKTYKRKDIHRNRRIKEEIYIRRVIQKKYIYKEKFMQGRMSRLSLMAYPETKVIEYMV